VSRAASIVLGYAIWLSVLNAAIRYALPLGWLVFGLLPVLAALRARRNPENSTFNLVKTVSVVAAALVILAVRTWFSDTTAIWPSVIVAIFFVNIAEAVVSDARRKVWPNVVAGVVLLVTIPGPSLLSVGIASPHDVLYNIDWPWILAYTVWNYTFVVNRRPHLAAVHFAVLLAPALAEMVTPGVWAESRAYTLGAHQLVSFGLWHTRAVLQVDGHKAQLERLGVVLQVLSPLLAAGMLAVWAL
jgi:hypothetical protein